ncbi:hypothetical protein [Ruminococcus albus]|uniref:Uncharacterized protein n=1 Tax=Ruminococcus albus 8 TaxID=246199 RepID=E9SA03_RUMAL|nr:hypothetical protein [Ruminococcus albus]EGC03867.1 hypothetical protein CUS_6454 [Ruminococcus albus 8]MCC3350517.1 hypothetical protein [Ruminococcus albus 8]
MREEFTYPSNMTYVFLFPTFVVTFVFVIAADKDWYDGFAVFGILLLLCFLILLILSFVPCSFDAQEKEVKFIKAFIKTDVIKYSEIRSMEIKREHYDTRSGTHWLETICFKLDDRELTFSSIMDIDYDKLSADPDELGKQFDNSKFSQLKRYIESKMNIQEEN